MISAPSINARKFKSIITDLRFWGLVILALFILIGICLWNLFGIEIKDNTYKTGHDSQKFLSDILLYTVTLFSSALSIISIFLVIYNLKLARSSIEASVMLTFNEQYFSETMFKSLNILKDYKRKLCDSEFYAHRTPENNPESNTKLFELMEGFLADLPANDELHKARRFLKRYYMTILDYYLFNYISFTAFSQLADKSGITLYFEVIEPIEYKINKNYEQKPFWQLMKLTCDIYKRNSETEPNKVFVRKCPDCPITTKSKSDTP